MIKNKKDILNHLCLLLVTVFSLKQLCESFINLRSKMSARHVVIALWFDVPFICLGTPWLIPPAVLTPLWGALNIKTQKIMSKQWNSIDNLVCTIIWIKAQCHCTFYLEVEVFQPVDHCAPRSLMSTNLKKSLHDQ